MYWIKSLWLHAFIFIWIIILPCVFWAFSIEMRSYISLSLEGSQIYVCLNFQQTLSIEAWLLSCFWVRMKTLRGLGYTVTGSISRGQTQLSMMMSMTKQVIHLPTRKAIFSLMDEGIDLLVFRNGKYFKM